MLSSSPASITQIVVVTVAIMLVLALGDAETVSLLRGWMGHFGRRTRGTTSASNENGEC